MLRLLRIEWLKYRQFKLFWIIYFLYLLFMVIFISSGVFILDFFEQKGMNFGKISPSMIPIYDFPDIWQNITYFAGYFQFIMAFIVIIFITNEYSYRTIRQNVIDGLSRSQFLTAKISFIFLLCFVNIIVLFINGLILGLMYSSVTEFKFIIEGVEFIPAFGIALFAYSLFAFFVGMLFKRSGVSIILFAIYTLFAEPFITLILQNHPNVSGFFSRLSDFLPMEAINNLIHNPLPRYILREIQNYIAWSEFSILLGYVVVFIWASYSLLKKRDF
jgi:ABC-2 type transport system permease protein